MRGLRSHKASRSRPIATPTGRSRAPPTSRRIWLSPILSNAWQRWPAPPTVTELSLIHILGVGELPTGTVTLLLADVEGSTRLWETQPEEMTAAVARLDRMLGDLLAAHGGVRPVEQGEGDSFVVAFARASEAAACALELQRAPLAPIRLRIGVHTGEVQLRCV